MRLWWLVTICLCACDSPSVSMQAQPAVQVPVGGHVFAVRVRGGHAESIRLDPAWPPPRAAAVVPLAITAMELASGCAVRPGSVRGDAAIQKATLDCS